MSKCSCNIKPCSKEQNRRDQKQQSLNLLHRPSPPFLFSGKPGSRARQRQDAPGFVCHGNSLGIPVSLPFFPCFLRNGRERTRSTLLPQYPSTPLPLRGTRRSTGRSKAPQPEKIRGVPLTTPSVFKAVSGIMPQILPKGSEKAKLFALVKISICLSKEGGRKIFSDRLFL